MFPRLLVPFLIAAVVSCSGEKTNAQVTTPAEQTQTETTPPTSENTQPEIDPISFALPESKDELFELAWDDLIPPGEAERLEAMYMQQMQSLFAAGPIAEGSDADVATQIGTFNTVNALNGQKVRIPGYTVPFEFGKNAKISEFLLVPTFGACLHNPPPPPNNTIYVVTEKPIKLKELDQAVWVEGYIKTQSAYNDLGNAAYTLEMTKVETYDY